LAKSNVAGWGAFIKVELSNYVAITYSTR